MTEQASSQPSKKLQAIMCEDGQPYCPNCTKLLDGVILDYGVENELFWFMKKCCKKEVVYNREIGTYAE